jgi:hypothetical protein
MDWQQGVQNVKTQLQRNPWQFTPLGMREAAVPVVAGLTRQLGIPQAADIGYALRGALNVTPFGGLGTSRAIPLPVTTEPTTQRQRNIQDVAQGIYGSALLAPIGGGIPGVARTVATSAGIGGVIGAGAQVIGSIGKGVPRPSDLAKSAAQGAIFGVKTAPTMIMTGAAVQSLAAKIPALNQLTNQSLQKTAPQMGQTVEQYLHAAGANALRRGVRAMLLETPIEGITYGIVNKQKQQKIVDSIVKEAVTNGIFNLGFAGVQSASETVSPVLKQALAEAVTNYQNSALSEQAGYIAPATIARSLKIPLSQAPEFVPAKKELATVPLAEISDRGAKLNKEALKEAVASGEGFFGDLVTHKKMMTPYPDLSDVPVKINPDSDKSFTTFMLGQPVDIELGIKGSTDAKIKSDLLHESQHFVQKVAGMPTGTTMQAATPGTDADMTEYRRWLEYASNPAESQARAVAARMNIPQAQLQNTEPMMSDPYAKEIGYKPPTMGGDVQAKIPPPDTMLYHGTPYNFKKYHEATTFFTPDEKFAYNYAEQKSFDEGLDLSPKIKSRPLGKAKIFDGDNSADLEAIRKVLPEKVSIIGAMGMPYDLPKDDYMLLLQGKVRVKVRPEYAEAKIGSRFIDQSRVRNVEVIGRDANKLTVQDNDDMGHKYYLLDKLREKLFSYGQLDKSNLPKNEWGTVDREVLEKAIKDDPAAFKKQFKYVDSDVDDFLKAKVRHYTIPLKEYITDFPDTWRAFEGLALNADNSVKGSIADVIRGMGYDGFKMGEGGADTYGLFKPNLVQANIPMPTDPDEVITMYHYPRNTKSLMTAQQIKNSVRANPDIAEAQFVPKEIKVGEIYNAPAEGLPLPDPFTSEYGDALAKAGRQGYKYMWVAQSPKTTLAGQAPQPPSLDKIPAQYRTPTVQAKEFFAGDKLPTKPPPAQPRPYAQLPDEELATYAAAAKTNIKTLTAQGLEGGNNYNNAKQLLDEVSYEQTARKAPPGLTTQANIPKPADAAIPKLKYQPGDLALVKGKQTGDNPYGGGWVRILGHDGDNYHAAFADDPTGDVIFNEKDLSLFRGRTATPEAPYYPKSPVDWLKGRGETQANIPPPEDRVAMMLQGKRLIENMSGSNTVVERTIKDDVGNEYIVKTPIIKNEAGAGEKLKAMRFYLKKLDPTLYGGVEEDKQFDNIFRATLNPETGDVYMTHGGLGTHWRLLEGIEGKAYVDQVGKTGWGSQPKKYISLIIDNGHVTQSLSPRGIVNKQEAIQKALPKISKMLGQKASYNPSDWENKFNEGVPQVADVQANIPKPSPLIDKAITTNPPGANAPYDAAFIAPDGRVISQGMSTHGQIARRALGVPEKEAGAIGSEIQQFMKQTGSVRVQVNPGSLNIDTDTKLTPEQQTKLSILGKGKRVYVDVGHPDGGWLKGSDFTDVNKAFKFINDNVVDIQANIPPPKVVESAIMPTDTGEVWGEIRKKLDIRAFGDKTVNPKHTSEGAIEAFLNSSAIVPHSNTLMKKRYPEFAAAIKDYADNRTPQNYTKLRQALQQAADTEIANRWKAVDTYTAIASNPNMPAAEKSKLIDSTVDTLEKTIPGDTPLTSRVINDNKTAQYFYDRIKKLKGASKVIAFDDFMHAMHLRKGTVLSADLDYLFGDTNQNAFAKVVMDRLEALANDWSGGYRLRIPKPVGAK